MAWKILALSASLVIAQENKPALEWPGCPALVDSDFRKVELGSFPFGLVTKFAIAKNGRIYGVGQGGHVGEFDPATKTGKEIGRITGLASGEWGLIGIALDPNFAANGRIFVHCYRIVDARIQMGEVRRYTISNGSLNLSSQKLILAFEADRGTVGHTGGGMAFDAAGNLFVSTGDNATPSLGSGNVSEKEWNKNSLRSAGNTNDLRGKVIRIRPKPLIEADPAPAPGIGTTYDIPAGNLFPPGMEKTRPEIYTMGHRNPFTLTVDQPTGWLFFGDVGPSAPQWTAQKGAAGMDEFNSAPKPGFYGWPMFIGPNLAFNNYDYVNNKPGAFFDSAAPINESKWNTGLRELPKPRGSLVAWGKDGKNNPWQSQFKLGGTVCIAGPVYRYNGANPSTVKLPPHFDGKWIVTDYWQNWIKAIAFDATGEKALNVEPAFAGISIAGAVDMQLGPDGALYILEWTKPLLSRIEYQGKCSPAVSVQPGRGPAPRAHARRLAPAENRLRLEAGDKGLSIFDGRGKRIWNWSGPVLAAPLSVEIPAGICGDLCFVRRDI